MISLRSAIVLRVKTDTRCINNVQTSAIDGRLTNTGKPFAVKMGISRSVAPPGPR